MSAPAQTKALAAALIRYAREGGEIDSGIHYDILYPLVDAARLACEAVREARGTLDGDDGQLLAALIHWIEP